MEEKSMNDLKNTEIMNKPIEEMNFSVRTYNSFRRAGILTVGEIVKITIPDLLKVRNLGKKGQIQTVEKIHALGLKMNGE